jgi:hypothetical protein
MTLRSGERGTIATRPDSKGRRMVDLSAISGALSSLKAANDIAQAMIGLRDAATFQGKLIEFQAKIIEANNSAFAAHDEGFALLSRIAQLEKQVDDVKSWENEKQRSELQELPPGVFVLSLKPAMANGEPQHRLCAKCYAEDKKSILQSAGKVHGEETLSCHGCGARMKVGLFQAPPPQNARPSWSNSRRG